MMLSDMSRKTKYERIGWIDSAKGMGILAVVMFHSGFLLFPEKTVPFLEAWMLPIFILAGGLLFNPKKNLLDFIRGKFKTIMAPFYLFGAVSFLGWLFLREQYSHDAIWMSTPEALELFLKGHDMWFNAPLWFLPGYFLCLLLVRIIYPLWLRVSNLVKASIIIGLIFLSFFIIKQGQRTFFSWDLALLFSTFMLFSNLFSNYKQRIILRPIETLIVGIIFFSGLYINGQIDIFLRFFNNPEIFWLNAVSGSLLITQVAYFLSKNKVISAMLTYLGKNSLIIMAIHWPLMQWLTYMISFTGLTNYLHSRPLLTGFTFPGLYAVRLWVLQLLLFLYTFFPVICPLIYKKSYSLLRRLVHSVQLDQTQSYRA